MWLSYSLASSQTTEEVTRTLQTSRVGLSTQEANRRLQTDGLNQLEEKKQSLTSLFVEQFRSPFIVLLLSAVFISFILKEVLDAVFILFFILLNAILGFWQEYRSHHSLELLKKYLVNQTHVRRDGKEILVDTTTTVPGDIVVLKAGDKIGADCRFIQTDNVMVDESILTGESAPVEKTAEKVTAEPKEYGEAINIGFSGTFLASGKAEAVVFATGISSQLGKIAQIVTQTKSESAFHQSITKLSNFILKLTLGTLVVLFVFNVFLKGSTIQPGKFLTFLSALAIGVVPEALPLVITVSLSQGALHLAKKKVVPKRLSAIEDLGSINVLATDKTGTITENVLTVAEVFSTDRAKTLRLAALASSFLGEKEKQPNNAFDLALWNSLSQQEKQKLQTVERIREEPFNPVHRVSTVEVKENGKIVTIVRGAPEYIDQITEGKAWMIAQGKAGKRVIGVSENGQPAGMISFIDPLKKTTKHAISEATRLGIQVKIISGDRPEVSGNVAYQIGLIDDPQKVITGEELEKLSEEEKIKVAKDYHVFARIDPEEKYKIIELLEHQGLTVGFLGEGFNDAPALKIAHVSLAVFGASDVAQDASDVILLNKSLEVVIEGIREGRKTFANTVKYIKLTLTSNFGNFYTMAIATLFLPFLPMLPIQILLVNLLTDSPLVSIATDNVERKDLLRPKGYDVKEIAFFATTLGLVSTLFDFAYFGYFTRFGEQSLQTMWFIGSTLTELIIFYSFRSRHWFFKAGIPSPLIICITTLIAGVTVILPFTSLGQDFFHFREPTTHYLLIAFTIVIAYFAVSEVVKILYYRAFTSQKN